MYIKACFPNSDSDCLRENDKYDNISLFGKGQGLCVHASARPFDCVSCLVSLGFNLFAQSPLNLYNLHEKSFRVCGGGLTQFQSETSLVSIFGWEEPD